MTHAVNAKRKVQAKATEKNAQKKGNKGPAAAVRHVLGKEKASLLSEAVDGAIRRQVFSAF